MRRLLPWRRRPTRPPRQGLVGTAAEAIAGTDVTGEPALVTWDGGAPQLVAFLTGGCATCQQFWTGFADPEARIPGVPDRPVVIVTPGPGTESRRGLAARVTAGMDVIMSTDAWIAFGVTGAPWFVLVADGQIAAEGPAGSWAELAALTSSIAPPAPRPGR